MERHRTEIQDGLLRVSQIGRWDEWVSFMSAAVHAEALEFIARLDKLIALREGFQHTLHGSKGVSLRIADEIGYPMITPTLAASLYQVSTLIVWPSPMQTARRTQPH